MVVLSLCLMAASCGSVSGELGAAASGSASVPAAAATPTPGRPAGSPGPGSTRASDDLGGWALDVPAGWFARPGPQHGFELRNFDPSVPLPGNRSSEYLPPTGGLVLTLHMRQNPDGLDPAGFFRPAPAPGVEMREHATMLLGGQPAQFWSIWRSQPSDVQRIEPTLWWYVRSPYFDDRMVVITLIPGATPLRPLVESVVSTLQFYRPTPPPLVPIVSRSEAIAGALGGVQTRPGATITRAEAKLVLYKEFETALGRSQSFVTDPDNLVWVVAYEGSGLYCGRGGAAAPPPDCRFAFAVQPARPPEQVGVFGISPTWPEWFGRLRDRDR